MRGAAHGAGAARSLRWRSAAHGQHGGQPADGGGLAQAAGPGAQRIAAGPAKGAVCWRCGPAALCCCACATAASVSDASMLAAASQDSWWAAERLRGAGGHAALAQAPARRSRPWLGAGLGSSAATGRRHEPIRRNWVTCGAAPGLRAPAVWRLQASIVLACPGNASGREIGGFNRPCAMPAPRRAQSVRRTAFSPRPGAARAGRRTPPLGGTHPFPPLHTLPPVSLLAAPGGHVPKVTFTSNDHLCGSAARRRHRRPAHTAHLRGWA